MWFAVVPETSELQLLTPNYVESVFLMTGTFCLLESGFILDFVRKFSSTLIPEYIMYRSHYEVASRHVPTISGKLARLEIL